MNPRTPRTTNTGAAASAVMALRPGVVSVGTERTLAPITTHATARAAKTPRTLARSTVPMAGRPVSERSRAASAAAADSTESIQSYGARSVNEPTRPAPWNKISDDSPRNTAVSTR